MQSPPKFIVRCSGIGEIMTNPRTKGDGLLSATCKTHLKKWLIRELSGKRVEVKTKQMDKGNLVEDDAIVYASCHIPEMGLCCKNEFRYRDGWMQGTPDVVANGWVIDLKSSYSADTFPLFETELPEADYAWQVLGYMALTEFQGEERAKQGAVVYALMSMPEQMIQREARYQLPENYTEEQYEAFAANYRYDDLEPALRLKKYVVEYEQEKVLAIRTRVEECRAYIETVLWPAFVANRQQFTEL